MADQFFKDYGSVTHAERYLEDELVSRILGRKVDQNNQVLPPQSADAAARAVADEINSEHQGQQAQRGGGMGRFNSPDVEDDFSDNDPSAPKKVVKAPAPIFRTDDDEEIRRKANLVREPSSAPQSSVQRPIPKANPKQVHGLSQQLSRYQLPGHGGESYYSFLKSMMAGDADGYISSALNLYKGDEGKALQSIIGDIEDELKAKGLYAPRQEIQPEVEPEPVQAQPESPAGPSDEELAQLIQPHMARKGTPKVIASLLNGQGIPVTPEKVKEIMDQIGAERAANRQQSILTNPQGDEDEGDEETQPIEDLVGGYLKSGLTSVKEILRLLRDEHGIKASPDQVRATIKDVRSDMRTADAQRGVDVVKRGHDEDEDLPDQEEDDDEEGDSATGLEPQAEKALKKFIVANAKKYPSPDKLARLAKKQLGITVDEDMVQDLMMDLHSKGKIRFEGFSFRAWLNRKRLTD